MVFIFLIGPALLIVWLLIPFIAKLVAFRTFLDSSQSYVLGHAWLAHVLSLTTKLIGLEVANRIAAVFGREPQGVDWIPLLYPFSAAYFLMFGFILGAVVEYGYCRWVLGARGRGIFLLLLAYNLYIDSIIAVPALIFYFNTVAGNVDYI